MFNFSLAVKASMIVGDFESKEQCRDFLDITCIDKKIISIDKVIYTFEDDSFLCCDGNDIKARAVGSDMSEFIN